MNVTRLADQLRSGLRSLLLPEAGPAVDPALGELFARIDRLESGELLRLASTARSDDDPVAGADRRAARREAYRLLDAHGRSAYADGCEALVRWATQRAVSIRAVAPFPVPPDPSFAGALDLVQIRTDALPVLEDALLATLAGERLPAGMRRRLLAGLAGRERTQGSEGPGGRVRAGAPAGAPEPGPRSAGR